MKLISAAFVFCLLLLFFFKSVSMVQHFCPDLRERRGPHC